MRIKRLWRFSLHTKMLIRRSLPVRSGGHPANKKTKDMRMTYFFRYACLLLAVLLIQGSPVSAQTKTRKILVIGVDGIINTAIDYAATPGIGALRSNGS